MPQCPKEALKSMVATVEIKPRGETPTDSFSVGKVVLDSICVTAQEKVGELLN